MRMNGTLCMMCRSQTSWLQKCTKATFPTGSVTFAHVKRGSGQFKQGKNWTRTTPPTKCPEFPCSPMECASRTPECNVHGIHSSQQEVSHSHMSKEEVGNLNRVKTGQGQHLPQSVQNSHVHQWNVHCEHLSVMCAKCTVLAHVCHI
jgi:hypothetical protein